MQSQCSRAAFGLLALTVLFAVVSGDATASRHYPPGTQFTYSTEGAVASNIAWGRAETTYAHHVLRMWDIKEAPNSSGNGYHARLENESQTWADAWDDTVRFTPWYIANIEQQCHPDPCTTWCCHGTAFQMVVDENDHVHVVFEVFSHPDTVSNDITIGYKNSAMPGWNAEYEDSLATLPIIVPRISGEYSRVKSANPLIVLQEPENLLHVMFGAKDIGLMYSRRYIADADTAWDDQSMVLADTVATLGNKFVFAIDEDDLLHLLGCHWNADSTWFFVKHWYGSYPGAGEDWELTEQVVAAYQQTKGSEGAEEDLEVPTASEANGSIHFAWKGYDSTGTKEIFFGSLTPPSTWSDKIQLSPSDGIPSVVPQLLAGTDGTLHLMYNEPGTLDLAKYDPDSTMSHIYHMWCTEDPWVEENWSGPVIVTEERETTAQWPVFLATDDDVLVSYTTHDDEDESNDDWEMWFKDVDTLPDTIKADSSRHWSDVVLLDADVYVEPNGVLTIDEGTAIYVEANYDRLKGGVDTARVEVIVAGELVLEGTSDSSVVFASADSTGEADWYGIRVLSGGSIEFDPVDPANEIHHALAGLAYSTGEFPNISDLSQKITMVDCFSNIALEGDAAVASGHSVVIPAGWNIGVLSDTDLAGGGFDAGLVELAVEGTLTLGGTLGSENLFAPLYDTAAEQEWYGLWVGSGGVLNLGYADFEGAVAALSVPYPTYPTTFLGNVGDKMTFTDCADTVVFIAPPGDTTVWNTSQPAFPLPVDFFVTPGGVLQIDAGTVVTIEPAKDIEIRADGPILAHGTQSQPVEFKPSSGPNNPGDWRGIRFLDGPDTSVSSLEYVEIEYPVFGVQLDSLSGTLFKPHFTGVVDDNDIYLDRDTRIPYGCEWYLEAPTRVVAAADSDYWHTGEEENQIEIVFNGTLRTEDPIGGEAVLFTASEADDYEGDAWYGVTVLGTVFSGDGVGVADIEDAEFSYARYPLAFLLADTAEVTDSYFHHYNQEAIIDWASDATIVGNAIERGPGMNRVVEDQVGRIGIHIASSCGQFEQNQIFYQMKSGIWADFSQSYCEGPPTTKPITVLTIKDNDVIGDLGFVNGECSGIDVTWACREQHVVVEDCNVQNWPGRGIRLLQSSDGMVKCNCVRGNKIGFLHRRDNLNFGPQDGHSRLKTNLLKDNSQYNVRTKMKGPGNESSGLYAGLSGDQESGGNLLNLWLGTSKNYSHFSAEWEHADTAQVNSWWDENDNPLESEVAINSKNEWLDIYEQAIEVGSFLTGSYSVPCVDEQGDDCAILTPPSQQGGGRAVPFGPGSEAADVAEPERASPTDIQAAETELPTVLAFYPPQPNPSREGVTLRLDIPQENAGWVDISIYDVTGRCVKALVRRQMPPGRHALTWGYQNENGSRVSSGVYFARIVVGSNVQIHRMVVLH